jgi:hypothetical protein
MLPVQVHCGRVTLRVCFNFCNVRQLRHLLPLCLLLRMLQQTTDAKLLLLCSLPHLLEQLRHD